MRVSEDLSEGWEARLYPEAAFPKYPFLKQLKPLLRTLSELGLDSDSEAQGEGYLLVREAEPPRRPALWIHERHLPLLLDLAQEIAALRQGKPEEEGAAEEQPLPTTLAALPWLDPLRRREMEQWARRSPLRQSETRLAERLLAVEGRARLEEAGLAVSRDASPPLRLLLGEVQIEGRVGEELFCRSTDLGVLPLEGAAALSLLQHPPTQWATEVRRLWEEERTLRQGQQEERYQSILDSLSEELPLLQTPELPLSQLWEWVRPVLLDSRIPLSQLQARTGQALFDRLWSRTERWLRDRLGSEVRLERMRGGLRLFQRLSLPRPEDSPLPLPRHFTLRYEDSRPLTEWLGPEAESHARTLRQRLRQLSSRRLRHWRRFLEDLLEEWGTRQNPGLYPPGELLPLFQETLSRALERDEPEQEIPLLRNALHPLDDRARSRSTLRQVLEERGMGQYLHLFPRARTLPRELVLFAGPTNSGKTHRALDALAQAESGVYLAPLRLLALEGQEAMQKRGVECSFLTGEERDLRPGARFVASTIEMLDLTHPVEAAIVDEAQMLADPHRGWAWTQALIGVPARRVYLTGALESIPLVEELARYLGEPLQVHRLERFVPLRLLSTPTSLADIRPGTALIAFSRRDVLGLKELLSRRFAVSVIYGNLTPQVRREEARRFRAGETQVLIATDAIAMGLNLPIETVLFYRTEKWNGRERVLLTAGEVLQIAGRAGRYGIYQEGWVGAASSRDLARVRASFQAPLEARALPPRFRVRPTVEHLEVFAEVSLEARLSALLEQFHEGMVFDHPALRSGVTEEMRTLARLTDRHLSLPLPDRYTFASAPVDLRSESVMERFRQWLAAFARGESSPLPRSAERFLSEELPARERTLARAEDLAKELTLYAWLAFRYPAQFPDLGPCDQARLQLDRRIEGMLLARSLESVCRSCKRPLPPLHPHSTCERCFRSRPPPRGRKREKSPPWDEDEWG